MSAINKELATAIKLAKSKKMYFAFIPKGADGKLIVSKKKIPPKVITDAKAEIKGGQPIIGKCSGPLGKMVFEVLKDVSPSVAAAVKKVAKRDSGLMLVPEFLCAKDAEEEEQEVEGEDETPDETPDETDDTDATDENATDESETDEEDDSNDTDDTGTPEEDEAEFDLAAWKTARQKAIADLKALAAKVAGTKHASAAGVIKEIQSIISKLPDNPKPNELDKLESYIQDDDAITAAEEVPTDFHAVNIRKPLLQSLARKPARANA